MDTPSFIVKNCTVIPVIPSGRVIKKGALVVEGDTIVAVGEESALGGTVGGHDKMDAGGGIVLPGLVNGHTHLPESLIRGVCDDEKLEGWLFGHVWPMEQRMTKVEARAGALLGCLELIKSGSTAFIDQYFFGNEIAEAVVESGIRGLIAPSIFDKCPESGSIEETRKKAIGVAREWYNKHERVTVGLGPHAPYSVPGDMLREVADFCAERDMPVHIHMQETAWEMDKAQKEFGKSPFQHLDDLGVTKARLLAAHCVVASEKDMAIMKQRNVSVLHNPTSNLKLASGIAPVKRYLDTGINVSVGTDGNASNNNLSMIEETMLAAILQKNLTGDPTSITKDQALEMATINGARAMGLDKQTGSLEKGKKADFIIISTKGVHMAPVHDTLSNVVYSSNASDVDTMVVGGKMTMEKRKVLTIDEKKVLKDAARAAGKMAGN